MKLNQKITSLAAAFVFFTGMGSAAMPAVQAAAVQQDAKAQLTREAAELTPIKNRNLTFVLAAKTINGKVLGETALEGNLIYSTRPDFVARGSVKAATALNGETKTQLIPFYMKGKKNSMDVYSQQPGGQWEKSTVKGENPQAFFTGSFEKELLQKLVYASRSVELLDRQPSQDVYMLTVDAARFAPALTQLIPQESGTLDGMTAEDFYEVCQAMGDVRVKVALDPQKKEIVGMESDLSQPLQKALAALGEKMPQAAEFARNFGNGYCIVGYKGMSETDAETVSIPKDVLKKAKVAK